MLREPGSSKQTCTSLALRPARTQPPLTMPFTVNQFFDVFARYNEGVWPAQLVLKALALLVVVLVVRSRPAHGRWIAAILAVYWVWMAVAYHFAYFTVI